MRGTRTAIAAALAIGTLLWGWCAGIQIHYPGRPPTIYTTLACFAVVILIVGALVSVALNRMGRIASHPWVCCGLVPYAVVTIYFEPFLSVHELGEIAMALGFLGPGVLVIFLLVHREEWVSLLGALLFLFVGSQCFQVT
jgi:hypothetical protein